MTARIAEFNMLTTADVVRTIDELGMNEHADDRIRERMLEAVDLLDIMECRSTADAVGLLSVVECLMAHTIAAIAEGHPTAAGVLAVALGHHRKALDYLAVHDAIEQSEAVRDGATIN